MIKWNLFLGCKDGSISSTKSTHINKMKCKNYVIISTDVENIQNSTLIYNKKHSTRLHIHTHTHIYIHVYICILTCVYIHVRIYTTQEMQV